MEGQLSVGISVVVPVYRSADSLDELVGRLCATFRPAGTRFEIILVDDGSPDRSWQVIEQLADLTPEIQAIGLSRNYGQHQAILAGVRAAQFDRVVTMDDDLQHRPEEIPTLVGVLDDEVDLVYGQSVEEEHGLWRSLSSRVVKESMAAAVGQDMAAKASAFRLFRTRLRSAFLTTTDPSVSIDVLLSWATTRVRAVPVQMDPRKYGRSNYTFRKLLRHASNMLTGFSVLPLRLVSAIGFACALFGFGVLVYVVLSFLVRGGSIPGFAFLASLIALLGGAQLFALGVLGEYLGRVHFRSMQRPSYVIRDTVSGQANAVVSNNGGSVTRTQDEEVAGVVRD